MAYLTQMLSQFSGMTTATPQYLFPTVQNLSAGIYLSEILDIKEIVDFDGNLIALDFYHKLTDSNGNNVYVRFRYYEKELPALAQELSKYSAVKTWGDSVGLREQVTVSPKATGNYMRISARNEAQATSSSPSTVVSPPVKKSGLLANKSKRGGSALGSKNNAATSHSVKASNLLADEEDFEDDEEDFLEDEDLEEDED